MKGHVYRQIFSHSVSLRQQAAQCWFFCFIIWWRDAWSVSVCMEMLCWSKCAKQADFPLLPREEFKWSRLKRQAQITHLTVSCILNWVYNVSCYIPCCVCIYVSEHSSAGGLKLSIIHSVYWIMKILFLIWMLLLSMGVAAGSPPYYEAVGLDMDMWQIAGRFF